MCIVHLRWCPINPFPPMKKKVFLLLGLVVLVVLGVVLWLCLRPRPIRVAAVNMPDFMLSRMVLSADRLNADVRPEDDLPRLSKYDAVLVFGMGLKWTEEDRDIIRALDEKGAKYTTMMVTTLIGCAGTVMAPRISSFFPLSLITAACACRDLATIDSMSSIALTSAICAAWALVWAVMMRRAVTRVS